MYTVTDTLHYVADKFLDRAAELNSTDVHAADKLRGWAAEAVKLSHYVHAAGYEPAFLRCCEVLAQALRHYPGSYVRELAEFYGAVANELRNDGREQASDNDAMFLWWDIVTSAVSQCDNWHGRGLTSRDALVLANAGTAMHAYLSAGAYPEFAEEVATSTPGKAADDWAVHYAALKSAFPGVKLVNYHPVAEQAEPESLTVVEFGGKAHMVLTDVAESGGRRLAVLHPEALPVDAISVLGRLRREKPEAFAALFDLVKEMSV